MGLHKRDLEVVRELRQKDQQSYEDLVARVAYFEKLDSDRCTTINSLTIENAQLQRDRDALRIVVKRVEHIVLIDPPHSGQILEIAAALVQDLM